MLKKIEFIKSSFNKAELIKTELPQVALCGRSNVGKSSFINSLFNRKNLAKTSSSPGKTRSINYYKVEDSFFLVDLPGYGYAKVSKEERAKWLKIIDDYFTSSSKIKLAIHFIDSRHKPTQLDFQLNEYLNELSMPYLIILSKADKLKQAELITAQKEINLCFKDMVIGKNLLFYSAVKGTWKKEVQRKFVNLLETKESFLI